LSLPASFKPRKSLLYHSRLRSPLPLPLPGLFIIITCKVFILVLIEADTSHCILHSSLLDIMLISRDPLLVYCGHCRVFIVFFSVSLIPLAMWPTSELLWHYSPPTCPLPLPWHSTPSFEFFLEHFTRVSSCTYPLVYVTRTLLYTCSTLLNWVRDVRISQRRPQQPARWDSRGQLGVVVCNEIRPSLDTYLDGLIYIPMT